MKFDGTITLGAVISAATFVVTLVVIYTKGTTWLENRFTKFEGTLASHGTQLMTHTERMDRYETRYVQLANDLQWLIGRMEGDRRARPRTHTDSEKDI